MATSIAANSYKTSWCGVICEGDNGLIYGTPTLGTDAEITAEKTLTIESNKILTIGIGTTLTNRGTIANNGTIATSGIIKNYGTITNLPSGGNIQNPSQLALTFAVKTVQALAKM